MTQAHLVSLRKAAPARSCRWGCVATELGIGGQSCPQSVACVDDITEGRCSTRGFALPQFLPYVGAGRDLESMTAAVTTTRGRRRRGEGSGEEVGAAPTEWGQRRRGGGGGDAVGAAATRWGWRRRRGGGGDEVGAATTRYRRQRHGAGGDVDVGGAAIGRGSGTAMRSGRR